MEDLEAATKITVDGSVAAGATLVTVSGRIGIEEANEIQNRFDDILATGRPWIILNLHDVDFVCSAGMGTLLSGVGEARRAGGEIIFTEISRKARTVFEFLDIWDYITAADGMPEALAMVAEGRRARPRPAAEGAPSTVIAEALKTKLEAGVRLSKEGKLKDALSYFNAVLKIDRDNATALTWKANAFERLGQFGEARRLYLRVMEIGRADPRLAAYARERAERLNAKLGLTPEDTEGLAAAREATRSLIRWHAERIPFLLPQRTVGDQDPAALEIYRTWDAGTPYEGDALTTALTRGGGCYVWFGRRGVVLDPGRGFLARFAAGGRRLVDVDAVVLSSLQADRRADFDLLLESVRRYNELRPGPAKRLEVFIREELFTRYYSWLAAATDVVSRVVPLEAGFAVDLAAGAAIDAKPSGGEETDADAALALVFNDDGGVTWGYIPIVKGADVDAVAARLRGLKGHAAVIEVGGLYLPGDVRYVSGESGMETLARLLIEVHPAEALLTGMINIAVPVNFAATLTRTTKVRCLPVDVGFRLTLTSSLVKLKGQDAPAAEVRAIQLEDGRLRYTAQSVKVE
jgi:anti-anti-sigma factor